MVKNIDDMLEKYRSELEDISKRIAEGESLGNIVEEYSLFTDEGIGTIGIGSYLSVYAQRKPNYICTKKT